MQKKNRKFLIYGLLGIVILVVTYFGIGFLKGSQLFKDTGEYYVYYDRVDGLNTSSLVQVNGYKIGKVAKIELLPDKDCKLLVTLELQNDYPIPDSSVAAIVSTDIMGTKGIDIIRPKTVNGYYGNGDTLRSSIDGGIIDQILDFVLPMKEDLAGFLTTSDSVMHALNQLLNEKNLNNLSHSLEGLSDVASHLSKNANSIDSIMRNFDKAARMLGRNTGTLERAIANFATVSDTLATLELSKTLSEAQEALKKANRLLATINEGNGTAQKILTNDSLYNNLEEATVRINRILDEFEKHPKKYINLSIFGGKEKNK